MATARVKTRTLILLLLGLSISASLPAASPPGDAVICVHGDSPLERHAAQEFSRYASEITGRKPEVRSATTGSNGKVVVSVGKNALTQALLQKGLVQLPVDAGSEGFVIKSVNADGRKYLVLLGGTPKATLYGVYHFLESVCGVGFFGDGEHVPRLASLPIEGIDISERPRFPFREYMMDCEYTSYWWDWSEWKYEVDWSAKHRFNLLSSNFDFTATWRRVWKKFGVDIPPASLSGPPFHPWAGWHKWDIRSPYPEQFQEFQADLCRKFVDYGRVLGVKMAPDYRGFLGQVPREFYEAYRNKARFIDVSWVDFDPPGKFIHPTDPLYAEVWKAYLEEYIKRFGTDHFYSGMTFSEMVPGETPADKELIKKANAERAAEVIRSIDPKGVVFSSSWTWLDKQLWPKESVQAYLNTFPGDGIQIWEQWNDQSASLGTTPMYKDLDYYFGKPWLLGFLFSYGGNTTLHGDLKGLIRRVQEVAQDPKASRCEGISLQPEALRHNHIWFDLLSRLAWNPEKIQIDAFLHDYATRRFGKDAAAPMVLALKELVASVYGVDDVTPPFYQIRITEEAIKSRRQGGSRSLSLAQRSRFIPHLRKALERALGERDRLARSPLYQHDLVDIGRQYQAELFDAHVTRLYDAFKAGSEAEFEKQARSMTEILRDQEALLSSSDFYCLQPILDKAMALPGVPKDFDEAIRDILTVWRGRILDYARRDYYELVRFYYTPRVSAFISHLREQMKKGSGEIRQKDLVAAYHEVEQGFVAKPFKAPKQERYQGTPIQAALDILKRRQQEGATD